MLAKALGAVVIAAAVGATAGVVFAAKAAGRVLGLCDRGPTPPEQQH